MNSYSKYTRLYDTSGFDLLLLGFGGRLRVPAWATSPPARARREHDPRVARGPRPSPGPGPWASGPGRASMRACAGAESETRGTALTQCTQHIERIPVCNIHGRCTNTGHIKEIWGNEPHGHTERRRGRGRASGGGGGGATRPTAESVDLKPRDAPQYAPSARGLRGTTYSVAAGWGAGPAGAYRHA